jgi:DNA-binding transcriptional LysR family regulator
MTEASPGPVSAPSPEPAGVPADRIALLETFVRIVEAGSLSAAAPLLRTTQPTISRRLRTLEGIAGRAPAAALHARHALTLDGERCYERARICWPTGPPSRPMWAATGAEPEGLLRVAVPHAFGQDKFVAPLADFLRAYPRVSVEWLLVDDVPTSLAARHRLRDPGRPADRPIAGGDPLAAVPRIVVGAPSLLAGAPCRSDPGALAALPWLALQTFYRDELCSRMRSRTRAAGALRPRVSTDSLYALRSAALHGAGRLRRLGLAH